METTLMEMIGMEMAGIFRKYWILLAALAWALSCTKEQEGAEPVARGDYDPMVHFGLETYVGADEPATKTTYAGDDQTYILNSVCYERINWNVETTDPYIDVVQVKSETEFTKNNTKTVDYKAVKIDGRTNKTGTKDSEADTAPVSGNVDDNLYWSASKDDRYFYAVYPSPNMSGSKAENFNIDASTHTATVVGSISPNTNGAESDRVQPYIDIKTIGTPGTPGSPASIEYLPDMTNAYMYAAAKVDGADAGYKKVPLRFKPLFSAVKLMITARDAGAQNYRLKKVELRTDLHYNDVYLRLNPSDKGTALGGKFKATFGLNGSSTGDFTIAATDVTDTLKRLTINIPETERYLLNEDTLKVTFLTLPVEQKYLVVDYTFEYYDATDAKWKEVRRFLTLQDRNKFFKDEGWYTLQKARKLYVRSGVPEIEYFFEVQTQGSLPRTWDPLSTKNTAGTHYLAEDFYSVKSYRDSSGVLQPLKWKVTGYVEGGSGSSSTTPPTWLYLDKEEDNGTPVTDAKDKFKKYSFVEYDAGGTDNGSVSFVWKEPVSFTYKDLDGNYVHPATYGDGSPDPKAGQSYAYDLSSHDIYGSLKAARNGEIYETANCYVVSAPGWYRFPLVYGCGYRKGSVNSAAYTGPASGANLMTGTFQNHAGQQITSPWITDMVDVKSVGIVWEDAVGLIGDQSTTGHEDLKPFVHDKYIYFYVNQVAQGNALISALDENGTVVWSWHIWAVSNPDVTLKVVGLESNQTLSSGADTDAVIKQSIYGTNYYWKETDLGQHLSEIDVETERYCLVEFTQYFKDKEIKKVVKRFQQSGVNDASNDHTLYYQWGRKDPIRDDNVIVRYSSTSPGVMSSIQHPDWFFEGTSSEMYTYTRYDNLWNAGITSAPTTNHADGRSTGSQDRKVVKTIYDPSPPGFKMPNLYGFSGLNPYGTIEHKVIKNSGKNNVVKDINTTYADQTSWHSGYIDFYSGYSAAEPQRRDKNSETIRFYYKRRLGGDTNNPGILGQVRWDLNVDPNNERRGHYWTSEPATFGDSWGYGRAMWMGSGNPTGANNVTCYPVYGKIGSGTIQQGWQRVHGLTVRPMRDDDP